jgi:hypothetical protein
MSKAWKKGRGKLGFMQPLIGRWQATADTPMGPVRCTRIFAPILHDTRIRLDACWEFGPAKKYEELAIIGVGADGIVAFWSFTSDGKRSEGVVADVTDLHPSAIGFEAEMDAGLARMAYWPDDDGDGFFWVVESKTKKGWRRFTHHHYRAMKD